ASAGEALRLLRTPPPTAKRWWLAVGGTCIVAGGIAAFWLSGRRHPAPLALATSSPHAEAPSKLSRLTSAVRPLVDRWVAAQNARDMDGYARCYAPEFTGIRRTPAGKELHLGHDEWLKDRANIFAQPVLVAVDDVQIQIDEPAATATVHLVQRFRR